MNKFIGKIFLFLLPIVLLGLAVELFIVYTPSAFNNKAHFLKNNKDIQCLFLGSSHTQNAINPEYLHLKSANMAYGGQDYQLDSALFFNYIKSLPHLKYLFIEVDYFSLEEKQPKDYFMLPSYYYYHNINLTDLNVIYKFYLYGSAPRFFNNNIKQKLNPPGFIYKTNRFGFTINEFRGPFEDCLYDDSLIKKSAKCRLKNRHTKTSTANYIFNKSKVCSIIEYCLNNNIKVFLLKTPAYSTYKKNFNKIKLHRRDSFIDSLRNINSIGVLDFENDKRFIVRDFRDDDHLNPSGAKKLTKIINTVLNNEEISTRRREN